MVRASDRKAPTLHDVARLAGVSVSTTSRGMGGYGRIAPATRELVQAAAATLGYRRNELARSMITGHTHTIGVICADMGSPFFAEALRAISDRAALNGFSTLIVNTDERLDVEINALALLREKQVDGVIAAPADVRQVEHLAEFHRDGRPIVLLDRSSSKLRVDSVTVDDVEAVERCVEMLIRQGHRRIGIVTELRDREARWQRMIERPEHARRNTLNPSSRRLLGYLHAHQTAGLEIHPELIARTGATSSEAARAAARRLLDDKNPPSAIVSVDNATSVGAYGAVRERGLVVPDDVSFIAFDNLDWTTLVSPALTVIEQPVYALGTTAADLLIARIHGASTGPRALRLATTLIERGSTRAIARTDRAGSRRTSIAHPQPS